MYFSISMCFFGFFFDYFFSSFLHSFRFFSNEKERKGVNLGGGGEEKLGETEKKTIIRIYCIKI